MLHGQPSGAKQSTVMQGACSSSAYAFEANRMQTCRLPWMRLCLHTIPVPSPLPLHLSPHSRPPTRLIAALISCRRSPADRCLLVSRPIRAPHPGCRRYSLLLRLPGVLHSRPRLLQGRSLRLRDYHLPLRLRLVADLMGPSGPRVGQVVARRIMWILSRSALITMWRAGMRTAL